MGWAEERARAWYESVGLTKTCEAAIKGAIREALEKAAAEATRCCDCGGDCSCICYTASNAIRALMEKS